MLLPGPHMLAGLPSSMGSYMAAAPARHVVRRSALDRYGLHAKSQGRAVWLHNPTIWLAGRCAW